MYTIYRRIKHKLEQHRTELQRKNAAVVETRVVEPIETISSVILGQIKEHSLV